MRNTLLATLVLLCTSRHAIAQTCKYLLVKSDSFWNEHHYDSALHYAWLAEPCVADSTTRDSKEYGAFISQFFAMNHEGAENPDSAGYWYIAGMNMMAAHHDTTSAVYGEALNNYGNMLCSSGQLNRGEPYLLRAEAVLKNHQPNESYLAATSNLANIYNYRGDYVRTKEMYYLSLAGLNRMEQPDSMPAMGKLLQNLGSVYNKTGNLEEAVIYYRRASVLFKANNQQYGYFETQKKLGLLYLGLRDTAKAEAIFTASCTDSLLTMHTGDNPNDMLAMEHSFALNGLATIKEAQQKYAGAEKLYRQSLGIAQKLTAPMAMLSTLGSLAHLYTLTGRLQQADSLYEATFELVRKGGFQDYNSYLTLYIHYCENLLLLNQRQKATEKIQYISEVLFTNVYKNFPGMAEDEQMKYLVSFNQYKNLLLSLIDTKTAATGKAVDYTLNRLLQLKGMILLSQQRRLESLRNTPDTALKIMTMEWLNLKRQVYNSTNAGASPATIDSLERVARMNEQAIAAKTGIPPEPFSDLLAATITSRLRAGEAAVEFIRYQQASGSAYHYGAFVLRPGTATTFLKLCTEAGLRKAFETGYSKNFNTLHQLKNGSLLRQLIWNPVEGQLQGANTVYYSPDGLLGYFSFDALPSVNKQHRFLLEDIRLVQLSGIRNLLDTAMRQNEPAAAAVLWGNIDCSEEAFFRTPAANIAAVAPRPGSLPVTETKGLQKELFRPLLTDELPVIKEIFQQKKLPFSVYEDSTATEENFKQHAAGFTGWLHISSHGFYTMNPSDNGADTSHTNPFTTQADPLLRCGLALNGANRIRNGKVPPPGWEDGILTGYEIATLDLSKVNLVVLSACETGLGDIDAGSEGILGLQRAFRLAGADKMIISLWNVNAPATKALIKAFYFQLAAGEKPAEALRNAKLQMMKLQLNQKLNLPGQWAGFVLVE